jgi:hypothetical protein
LKPEEQKRLMNTMSNPLNGIDVLRDLFPDDDSFVQHIVNNTLFFNKEVVKHQALQVQQEIERGDAVPVRYTSNGYFYHQREVNKVTSTFKSKREAVHFTKENPLFHKKTGIRIYFDKDGNYYPKQAILQYTGHRVSWGKEISTITNYTIAHIWGETDNPLYFGLLWNYCLLPAPYAFLTDKHDDTDVRVKRIKDLIKAISVELYNPNSLMNHKVSVEMPPKDALAEATALIEENKIHYVTPIK